VGQEKTSSCVICWQFQYIAFANDESSAFYRGVHIFQ